MAQLSRPFQIALVAMCLFAAAWFLALRGHSSSTSAPESAPTPSPSAGSPSSVYHGSAPGVEGLSKAIAKAHGAVSASEQNAKSLEQRSAQASGGTTSASPSKASAAPKLSAGHKVTPAPKASPAHKLATPKAVVAPKAAPKAPVAPKVSSTHATVPSMQPAVEAELKQGKIVTVLFWNPKASDDAAVHREVQSVGNRLRSNVAVHYALASQVGSFGTITSGVQVYGTPTLLIINKKGRAQALTGLTDAYAIEQAIGEARHS